MKLKVTVCELDCGLGYKQYIDQIEKEKSDLIVLPEMPAYFWFPSLPQFNKTIWQEALKAHDEFISMLHEISNPLISTRPVQEDLRLNQAFCYFNGYQPLHNKYYFPNERGFYEARWFQRREKDFKVFKINEISIGILICSELMFNEWARYYGKQNAHIIAVPRATTNLERWKVALQMAAIVSGSFVLSSNRVGEIGFNGFGCVVDPEGNIIAHTSKNEPFVTVRVDLKEAEKAKKTYPRNIQD